MTKHKHADLIKAWADGAEIQVYSGGYWVDTAPSWNETDQYRIKPEKDYPKSSLSYDSLCKI
jgi:hypothetical protein